ncbi:MAG: hypothetical protein ACOC1F_13330 [Myxococcota bacterium]
MSEPPAVKKLLESLPEDVAQQFRTYMSKGMRLRAGRALLERFRGHMHLETLGTGVWRGKNITGEEIQIEMSADSVAFEQSRVELHVAVELGIQVPSLRKRKVFTLGPVHESVATPALPRITLSSLVGDLSASFLLSSVRADEVTADVAPIDDVDAGIAYADDLWIEELEAPSDNFSLYNIRFGPMALKSMGAQGAKAKQSGAGRVGVTTEAKAQDVTLRGAKILGGCAMAAEGDDLNLGFEVQLPALTIRTFPSMPDAIERLVTRLSVKIEPKVRFQIGKLKLEGMSLNTKVGTLRIGDLAIPIDVRGARFEDVEMRGMNVDDVVVDEDG